MNSVKLLVSSCLIYATCYIERQTFIDKPSIWAWTLRNYFIMKTADFLVSKYYVINPKFFMSKKPLFTSCSHNGYFHANLVFLTWSCVILIIKALDKVFIKNILNLLIVSRYYVLFWNNTILIDVMIKDFFTTTYWEQNLQKLTDYFFFVIFLTFLL